MLEFFAGVGRVASVARLVGLSSLAYDLSYGAAWAKRTGKRSPMDINSNAGFVLLCKVIIVFSLFESPVAELPSFLGIQPRLAVAMILKADFGLLAMFATCCSTWSAVSRGSGGRTICTPMGCDHYTKIRRANKMVARTGMHASNSNILCDVSECAVGVVRMLCLLV